VFLISSAALRISATHMLAENISFSGKNSVTQAVALAHLKQYAA